MGHASDGGAAYRAGRVFTFAVWVAGSEEYFPEDAVTGPPAESQVRMFWVGHFVEDHSSSIPRDCAGFGVISLDFAGFLPDCGR